VPIDHFDLQTAEGAGVKARVISFYEIEEQFRKVLLELAQSTLDEASVIELGSSLPFMLGLCLSQMSAPNSSSYPEKDRHIAILEEASKSMTYAINTCTAEQINLQVTEAYGAFKIH
jgi:hypothetical protein